MVEDHPVDIVGKCDIQESLLLVVKRQINDRCSVGDIVIDIDNDLIGRRERVTAVIGASDEEGNWDLSGSE